MTVLVLGGAGYIGSHMVDRLVDQQTDVAVVDNLVKGHRAAVRPEARFYEGDVRDKEFMRSVFKKKKTSMQWSTLRPFLSYRKVWRSHWTTLTTTPLV